MERIITHLDMDCFFCQCEEKQNPALKNNPVIVGSTGGRGVVSAANYEARKYGVFSATPISVARKLCPEGFFLPVNKTLYKQESDKIMSALGSVCDGFEQVSVDEAYLDITSIYFSYGNLEKVGLFLQNVVKDNSQMSCSVGISNSRYVSKIASDYRKPGGITVVEDVSRFLFSLDIGKIPGIGKVSKKKFNSLDVWTIGELAEMDKFKLMDSFGVYGVQLQNIAKGLDRTGLNKNERIKSYSRENTFSSDVSDFSFLKDSLRDLCERVHVDLGNYFFRTVSLKIRYQDFVTITRDVSLKTSSRDIDIILDKSFELFEKNYTRGRPVRLIGVKLSNITGGTDRQLTLDSFGF